tara:strand:+ start:4986 stop:5519 length:534 start_codon:yes stop_codon:yes gene_type:complete
LVPWERNPRKNDPAVGDVARSITKFGFGTPIVARKENNEIIAGHTRHKAALLIGYSPVPVRFLDLSENEAHALAIVDNQTNEIALWDESELDCLLEELESELDGICEFEEEEEVEEEDACLDQDDAEVQPEENPLLDKLNAFVARSEQKSRQKKVWSKADHKAVLEISEELRGLVDV